MSVGFSSKLLLWGTFVKWIAAEEDRPSVVAGGYKLMGFKQEADESLPQPIPQPVDMFFGIPYALPPVGPLRLRPPKALPQFEGEPIERAAGKEESPAQCIQDPQLSHWFRMSEDCLYLNVFTPSRRPEGKPLPVMVFLHDGRFMSGGASDYEYPGVPAVHDVVLVGLNYRLGALGFMASQELLEESGTTGNYGLQDQRMALEWVRDNIAVFGGDPSNVGLYGVSAGAMSVLWHLVSPASFSLFHKAIISSASVSNGFFPPLEDMNKYWDWHASTLLECSLQDIACLRRLPAREFVVRDADRLAETNPSTWNSPLFPLTVAVPVIDMSPVGLQGNPLDLIKEGRFSNIPLLIGTVKDEGTIFQVTSDLLVPEVSFPPPLGSFKLMVEHAMGPNADMTPIYRMYNVTGYGDAANSKLQRTQRDEFLVLSRMLRDLFFGCVPRQLAEAVTRAGGTAYTYSISEPMFPRILREMVVPGATGYLHVGDIGSFHTSDRALVLKAFTSFGNELYKAMKLLLEKHHTPTADANALSAVQMTSNFRGHYENMRKMSDVLSCAWTNFIKFGNPAPQRRTAVRRQGGIDVDTFGCSFTPELSIPEWKPFSLEEPSYMRILVKGSEMVPLPSYREDTPEMPSAEKCHYVETHPLKFRNSFEIRKKMKSGDKGADSPPVDSTQTPGNQELEKAFPGRGTGGGAGMGMPGIPERKAEAGGREASGWTLDPVFLEGLIPSVPPLPSSAQGGRGPWEGLLLGVLVGAAVLLQS